MREEDTYLTTRKQSEGVEIQEKQKEGKADEEGERLHQERLTDHRRAQGEQRTPGAYKNSS